MNIIDKLSDQVDKLSDHGMAFMFAAGILCLTAAMVCLAVLTGEISFYHGLNSGILIGHSFGLEVHGTPAFFRCDGQC